MSASKGVEKRKFCRLDLPLQVTMTIISDEKPPDAIRPLKVQSRNVSQDGICVETSEIVVDSVNMLSGSPGARENQLKLEIELVPGQVPLKALGEVCWYDVDRETEQFRYQVGVVFTSIDDNEKERLRSFLKSRKGEEQGFFQKLLSFLRP